MCFTMLCAGFPPRRAKLPQPVPILKMETGSPKGQSLRQTRQKCIYTIAQLYKSFRFPVEKSISLDISNSPDNFFQGITSRLQNQHGYPPADIPSPGLSYLLAALHTVFFVCLFVFVFVFVFFLIRAAPVAYVSSQEARNRFGAATAGLHHSPSSTRSELCL